MKVYVVQVNYMTEDRMVWGEFATVRDNLLDARMDVKHYQDKKYQKARGVHSLRAFIKEIETTTQKTEYLS